ncbi:MAG: efflux RND transporter periplasmic adaptor subunit [Armatimonadota bacterium]|nr:MAG: efflux RND transporter periplasmic adaptor subunit [Armatimonadota bacterium]
MKPRGAGTRTLVWLIVVAVVAVLGWRVYHRIVAQRNRPAPQTRSAVPVETAAVVTADLAAALNVTGSVEPDRKAALASKIPGKVVAVTVDEGERVAEGQVVVRLDDSDVRAQVAQARAAVEAAEAARGMAQAQLDLALAGARPQERQQAQANVAQARAALEAARAGLEALRKGAREQERAQAQQAVRQAKAGLDNAEANLRRAEELLKAGAISEQQVDLARTQYQVAEAQYQTAAERLDLVREGARTEEIKAAEERVKQADAGVRVAEQQLSIVNEGARAEDIRAAREQVNQAAAGVAQARAALQAAQVMLDNTVIRSALGGEVAQREVDPGQTVVPSQPLLAVVDNRQVYVKAKVGEDDVRNVRPGQSVEVTVDAYPGETFAGRVTEILPAAEVETRMFHVRVRIPNPQGRLKSGMFARCAITLERLPGVTAVPRSAVVREGDGAAVFVVRAGKAHRVAVKLGVEQGDLAQALAGVTPGDAVVVAGHDTLRDGDAVRVTGGS